MYVDAAATTSQEEEYAEILAYVQERLPGRTLSTFVVSPQVIRSTSRRYDVYVCDAGGLHEIGSDDVWRDLVSAAECFPSRLFLLWSAMTGAPYREQLRRFLGDIPENVWLCSPDESFAVRLRSWCGT